MGETALKGREGLIIDWIGGNCPVQAEGTIAGKPFYFRARGRKWSFEVGDGDLDDIAWVANWHYEESYGDGPYDAGWMPEKDALRFIQEAVQRYLADQRARHRP